VEAIKGYIQQHIEATEERRRQDGESVAFRRSIEGNPEAIARARRAHAIVAEVLRDPKAIEGTASKPF
jgi:hypothetical protein